MSPAHEISNVERLIDEINRIHARYHERVSKLYGGNLPNLSKMLRHLDIDFVLQYRLNLHESINDYLIRSDIGALPLAYYYRVKTTESVFDKNPLQSIRYHIRRVDVGKRKSHVFADGLDGV